MPILGLTSGKTIKISKKQYDAFMNRREAYIGGVMIEVYDENKKPLGKIKTDCIEFISPDDSKVFANEVPIVEEKKPFNTLTARPPVRGLMEFEDEVIKKPGRPVKKD